MPYVCFLAIGHRPSPVLRSLPGADRRLTHSYRQMGTPRIATDIRIGTRTDKKIAPGEGNKGKVARVVEILGKDQPKA
jgi:hypothetical protein